MARLCLFHSPLVFQTIHPESSFPVLFRSCFNGYTAWTTPGPLFIVLKPNPILPLPRSVTFLEIFLVYYFCNKNLALKKWQQEFKITVTGWMIIWRESNGMIQWQCAKTGLIIGECDKFQRSSNLQDCCRLQS
ncbi:hypothetical protein CDAR_194821 [Caerostris darwini]|uniref:Uncharacterized protein n=1 Tax=Caerostris darwini TaxID=1538125 RepID=A0AAV4X779_9ARAC|nr:hypothetical protein CDAR_194821 [Caerostris darwini]